MSCGRPRFSLPFLLLNSVLALGACIFPPTALAQDSSSSNKHKANTSETARSSESALDAGSVKAGVYRNVGFGFTCKVPAGWVLRTDEMNASDQDDAKVAGNAGKGSRVLLAAFSRPPEARAEDVNSSILIAAESVAGCSGVAGAAQVFGAGVGGGTGQR